jgi:hypothetical protein
MAFQCSLEDFKQMVAKYCRHFDEGIRGEPLDASFKCITLHYLNMIGDAADKAIAVTYMEFAMRRHGMAMGEV